MANPLFAFTIAPEEDGRALAGILRTRFGMSRGLIRRLKRPGCVLIDGESAPVLSRVRAGQRVEIFLPDPGEPSSRPEPLPLAVVYEDQDVLVAAKPAGLLVHPSGVDLGGALVNAVAHHLMARGEPGAAGPVTRLDRGTSGLVLFAKHPYAHHRLSVSLNAGRLTRRYLALAEGDVHGASGCIEAPIRRADGSATRRVVAADGQWARTRFTVLARLDARPLGAGLERLTLLDLTLDSGRTHQIRVHLAHVGHPVFGDPMYGRGAPAWIGRQALHAYSLAFDHPRDGRPLAFRQRLPDELPGDLRRLLGALGDPPIGDPAGL